MSNSIYSCDSIQGAIFIDIEIWNWRWEIKIRFKTLYFSFNQFQSFQQMGANVDASKPLPPDFMENFKKGI